MWRYHYSAMLEQLATWKCGLTAGFEIWINRKVQNSPTRKFSNKRNSEQKFETAKQHLINSWRSLFPKFPIHYRLFNFHLGVPGRAGADGIPGKEGKVVRGCFSSDVAVTFISEKVSQQISIVTREYLAVTNVFSITSLIPFLSRAQEKTGCLELMGKTASVDNYAKLSTFHWNVLCFN